MIYQKHGKELKINKNRTHLIPVITGFSVLFLRYGHSVICSAVRSIDFVSVKKVMLFQLQMSKCLYNFSISGWCKDSNKMYNPIKLKKCIF